MAKEWLKLAEYSTEEDSMFDTSQSEFVESLGDCIANGIANATKRISVEICKLWHEMGLAKQPRQERINDIITCILELYENIAEGERTSLKKLQKIKEDSLKDLKVLTHELGEPDYKEPSGLPLLAFTRNVYLKCKELREMKDKRSEEWQNLLLLKKQLCVHMGMNDDVPHTATSIPNADEMMKLKLDVKTLEEQKKSRINKFVTLQKSIVASFDQLEREPRNAFEKEVLNSEAELFILSSCNLKKVEELFRECEDAVEENSKRRCVLLTKMKNLWDRLDESPTNRTMFLSCNSGSKPSVLKIFENEIERLETLKKENMGMFIEKLRPEIILWWRKCFIGDDKREQFEKYFNDHCYTEELLEIHERELDLLKQYYEETKEIFIGIETYEELWRQFLDLESKANDPERFHNRGGKLLKEAQERRKLQNRFPKIEATLLNQKRKWSEDHNGEEVLIYGMNLESFINEKWTDFNASKENKKIIRQQHKKDEIEAAARGRKNAQKNCQGFVWRNTPASKTKTTDERKNQSRTPRQMGTPLSASKAKRCLGSQWNVMDICEKDFQATLKQGKGDLLNSTGLSVLEANDNFNNVTLRKKAVYRPFGVDRRKSKSCENLVPYRKFGISPMASPLRTNALNGNTFRVKNRNDL